jgi:von Willebrand factor type A domain
MNVSFLTPLAGLVTLAAAVPLVAFVRSEQRAARVREVLRLAPPGGSQRTTVAAIVVLAVLLGIGAAQPVIEETTQQSFRSDAQAFFVLDTSRSMLASTEPGEATRFERAREAALRFRDGLEAVPVGLASLTDRVLPLVFPTGNRDTFESTLRLALDVDRPASSEAEDVRATEFGALASVGERNFFRGGKRRLAVVFTDAETTDFNPRSVASSLAEGNVELIVVRFSKPGERVFGPEGAPEPYEPDLASGASAERLADAAGGRAFDEDELGDAIDSARSTFGEGPTVVTRAEQSDIEPLAPYVFLAALLPLGLLLYRRNFA